MTMMRKPRIEEARAAKGQPLHVMIKWAANDSWLTVDLAPLVKKLEALAPLEDPVLFERAHVGELGWSIEWSDDLELGAETLWRLTLEQRGDAMSASDFRAWRERNGLSLTSAADVLGLSRRVVAYYLDGRRIIPKTVLLATKGYDASSGTAIRLDPELLGQITIAAAARRLSVDAWVTEAALEKLAPPVSFSAALSGATEQLRASSSGASLPIVIPRGCYRPKASPSSRPKIDWGTASASAAPRGAATGGQSATTLREAVQ
jgi:transcriptional regulator with XRE-family HTH domain